MILRYDFSPFSGGFLFWGGRHDGGMSALVTTVLQNEGKAPMALLWAPKGEHEIFCSVNGQPGSRVVKVTPECVERLNADLEKKLAGNVKPVGLYDHQPGPAAYRPKRFLWDEDKGVVLELEGWTQKGRQDVEGGNYGYHSPKFRRDAATGEILGLIPDVAEVGSLVNDPAFDEIERIAASRGRGAREENANNSVNNSENIAHFQAVESDAGRGDDVEDQRPEGPDSTQNKNMDINKLKECGLLTADEAAADNAEAVALERIISLMERAKEAADELEAGKQELETYRKQAEEARQREEERAASDVEEAVAAGKIAPRDEAGKAFWKRCLTEDYIAASRQLQALPKNPAFEDIHAGKERQAPLSGTASLRSAFENELNHIND